MEHKNYPFGRIRHFQERLEQAHGVPSDDVISAERHALAMNLFEQTSTVIHPPKKDIRIAIDYWVMHKFFGYLILAVLFYGFFNFIFGVGGYIEGPLIGLFNQWVQVLGGYLGKEVCRFFYQEDSSKALPEGLPLSSLIWFLSSSDSRSLKTWATCQGQLF